LRSLNATFPCWFCLSYLKQAKTYAHFKLDFNN
jgi:hypothetical protein